MAFSTGDRLGRYELLGPLGAGGMGEVWRARDTELERLVAIKVLPEAVASDPKRLERFRREGRALAALSHPNLLEVHDVGGANGVNYVVTELLEGDTVRATIPPAGLPWQKVTEIGAAVADGLAAAHRKGIVHRDLKPENLFLTADGRVKILDFGLAAVDDEIDTEGDSPTVTEDGAVLGTAGYMAPEQLRGGRADARSDIFSLGCVLYEMASGRRAFTGDSAVEIMAAILKEEPPQLSSSGASVPVDLERAVHRCLGKRPEARYQSAADLAYSLKNIGSGTSAPVMATPGAARRRRWWQIAVAGALVVVAALIAWQSLSPPGEQAPVETSIELDPNRIAVVPFANRTGDSSLDGLGRRIAARIIQELGDIDEIEVAPRNVVSGTVEGRAALGTEAHAIVSDVAAASSSGLVVTGVIYGAADELEIQANLNNAVTGLVVRAFDTLNTTPDEVDTALDTLAGWVYVTIFEELHPSLRFGAGDRIPDAAAFREYVTGLPNLGIHPESGERLTRALEMDPEFERLRIFRAFAAWGADLWRFSDWMITPLEDRRSELTPSQQKLVDGIRWGLYGRWVGALKSFQQYMTDHPEQSMFEVTVIMSAVHANRPRTALEAFDRFRMDPVFPANAHMITCLYAADAHHLLGQHEQELDVFREFWQTQTKFFGTTWIRGPEARALAALGRIDECLEVVAEAMTEPSHGPERYGGLMVEVAADLRAHGHEEASRTMARRALDWFARAELPPDTNQKVRESSITALGLLGRHEEAYSLAQQLMTDHPEDWRMQAGVGIAAARTGDRSTATEISTRLSQVDEPFTMGMPSYFRAAIAAQLGDRAEAIRLLQQAMTRGFHDWGDLHVNIDFDPIRGDPEFEEILRPKG